MVVRTGLYTSMGSMMRQILTHSKADKSVFLQVTVDTAQLFCF